MRKHGEKKRGALTIEQAKEKAAQLIQEHGICLFIVDIVGSSSYGTEINFDLFELFDKFLAEANEKFSAYMPRNELAVGSFRPETGFEGRIGDASWAGITDAKVIPLIAKLKDENYPELPLYYGVAKDGWDKAMELAK